MKSIIGCVKYTGERSSFMGRFARSWLTVGHSPSSGFLINIINFIVDWSCLTSIADKQAGINISTQITSDLIIWLSFNTLSVPMDIPNSMFSPTDFLYQSRVLLTTSAGGVKESGSAAAAAAAATTAAGASVSVGLDGPSHDETTLMPSGGTPEGRQVGKTPGEFIPSTYRAPS